MEFDPISRRRPAHENQAILLQMKKNAVTYDKAIKAAGRELLSAIDGKIGKAIGCQIGEHFQSVGTFHVEVGHMMRLVK